MFENPITEDVIRRYTARSYDSRYFRQSRQPTCNICKKKVKSGGFYFTHQNIGDHVCIICYSKLETNYGYSHMSQYLYRIPPTCSHCTIKITDGQYYFTHSEITLCLTCFINIYVADLVEEGK